MNRALSASRFVAATGFQAASFVEGGGRKRGTSGDLRKETGN